MKRRDITVLVVPHGNSKIRSYRIPVVWVKPLLILVPAALIFCFFLVGSSLNLMSVGHSLRGSRNESLTLRGKLEAISSAVEELRGTLSRNLEFEKRARVLADLGPIDEDVRLMGVGGPEPAVLEPSSASDRVLAEDVKTTEMELDELIRQTRLQTESLTEVVTKFEERRDLWNHTPSICPVPGGFMSSGFGARIDPFTGSRSFHEGVDICAPRGTQVLATADGTVRFASRHAGYGLMLGIDHGNGITTWYAHVDGINVANGQSVRRNQIVATVGTSGRVTAPHVHYEVHTNLKPVDPLRYILPANAVVD
ncbi:MAG: M23 family metallopeptidase [Candidatus Eisenbacteria bacterium]|nr:M23 family metallopeptidase [Candidatus Eisenbacteria bacterium]